MASITFKRDCLVAGIPYAVGNVVSSFALGTAANLVNEGDAYWTGAPGGMMLPGVNGEAFLADVVSLTGGDRTAINGYTVSHLATGKTFACVISGRRRIYQLQDATAQTANGDSIVQPPDFDSASNNRFLVEIQ